MRERNSSKLSLWSACFTENQVRVAELVPVSQKLSCWLPVLWPRCLLWSALPHQLKKKMQADFLLHLSCCFYQIPHHNVSQYQLCALSHRSWMSQGCGWTHYREVTQLWSVPMAILRSVTISVSFFHVTKALYGKKKKVGRRKKREKLHTVTSSG